MGANRKQSVFVLRVSAAFSTSSKPTSTPISQIPVIHQCEESCFRPAVTVNWDIVEKETVDEIIFRTARIRNRIMLELMAQGCMRIGEVLKLRPKDIQESKLVISEPKSGKEYEYVFIPKKVAERLRQYARQFCRTLGEYCSQTP
jgi:hypothetical protein